MQKFLMKNFFGEGRRCFRGEKFKPQEKFFPKEQAEQKERRKFLESIDGDKKKFTVDFKGDKKAEASMGLGDMIRYNESLYVKVFDPRKNSWEYGIRGIKNSRMGRKPGYFNIDTGEYIEVLQGYKVHLLGNNLPKDDELEDAVENNVQFFSLTPDEIIYTSYKNDQKGTKDSYLIGNHDGSTGIVDDDVNKKSIKAYEEEGQKLFEIVENSRAMELELLHEEVDKAIVDKYSTKPSQRSSELENFGVPVFKKLSPLRNLISGGESTPHPPYFFSPYDAYNRGNASQLSPKMKKPLTQMTIGEIRYHQKIAGPYHLSAVGAWQMIGTTLEEVVAATPGVNHSTLFTPAIQEKLFISLIRKKRPQIWAYLSGSGTLYRAHKALAREWAAVASPDKNGEGEYEKIAGNKATISSRQVWKILKEVKKNFSS